MTVPPFHLNTDDMHHFLEQAFSRNLGLLSKAEMIELRDVTVAIPGLGGVGGLHLTTLSRTGIGNFKLADFDCYEAANINRQVGARLSTLGKSKLECAAADAKEINPTLNLSLFEDGLTLENLDNFLENVDIVVDSLDFFAFDIRRKLFMRSRELGIPVVTAGPVGFSTAMLIFMPNQGMSFDQYFNINDDLDPDEKIRRFTIGLAPNPKYFSYIDFRYVDLENRRGPSLSLACLLCGAAAATEVLRILLKRGPVKAAPYYHQYDPYLRRFKIGYLPFGNRNPWQRFKIGVLRKKRAELLRSKDLKDNIPTPPTSGMIDQDTINYLVDAGIQAPSGDNIQPWSFEVSNSTIGVILNRKKDESFFNYKQIASTLSCGSVVENIIQAAAALGLNVEVCVEPESDNPNLLASIELSVADTSSEHNLSGHIWLRRTNRKPYQRKPLLASSRKHINQSIDEFPLVTNRFLTTQNDLKRFQQIARNCDRIRQEIQNCHEHLFATFRWSEQAELETRDGFPIKSLEAGFLGENMLRIFKPWPLANLMNKIGFNRIIAHKATENCSNSGGIGFLTAKDLKTSTVIQAGQAFQRIWLGCTSLGFYLHPCAMPAILFLYLASNDTEALSSAHVQSIEKSLKEIENLFPDFDRTNEFPLMFYRVGEGAEPSKTTIRKHRDELIVKRT